MDIFILTQSEGKKSVPVAATTIQRVALDWFEKDSGNDFYPLELGRVDHLGLTQNDPGFTPAKAVPTPPPARRFTVPKAPAITPNMKAAVATAALSEYLAKLTKSMDVIQQAIDG